MNEDQGTWQLEARNLFQDLSSWREDSNRHFSNIINSHCSLISKGIQDVVQENSALRNELSVMKEEKGGLIRIVDSLKTEIRQLRTMTPPLQDPDMTIPLQDPDKIIPLQDPVKTIPLQDPEAEDQEEDIAFGKEEKGVKVPEHNQDNDIINTNDDHEMKEEGEAQELSKMPHNDNEKPPNEVGEILGKKKKVNDRKEMNKNATKVGGDKMKQFPHQKQDGTKSTVGPPQLKKIFQCDVCGFMDEKKNSIQQHKNAVHNKKVEEKKLICEICPATFKCPSGLANHKLWRHADDKKYECDICPYTTSLKKELVKHMKVVHKKTCVIKAMRRFQTGPHAAKQALE